MCLFTLLLTLILCVLTYLWYFYKMRKYKDIEKIPGPPVKFFFGNALEFGSNLVDIFNNCQRLIKTYGPLVRIWQGPFALQLIVTDPDYVEYFLSSTVHLEKSVEYRYLQPWIGLGLVTSSGERWRERRKILTPAFHLKILEQSFEYFNFSGEILINKLKQEVGKNVDVHSYVKLYALDVLCESLLRIQINAQDNSEHPLLLATEEYFVIFINRLFSVFKRYDFFFQFTDDYRRMQKSLAFLQEFTYQVIQQRKRERIAESESDDVGAKKKKAFLDVALDSNQLKDEDIQEEINTLLGAGHETVAIAISSGLFELAKHSDVQKRILDEIHEVIGRDKNSEITLARLNEMKYFDCVVKELLRLHPSVPLFQRQLTEDIILDGIGIPKGTTITFQPYFHNRNEKYFPEPDTFDPDRFLLSEVEKRHPFSMITFSAGPRKCIGSKYALLTCKTTIANVIRNFELLPVQPRHEPLMAASTVMKSLNGLPIILKLRE